MAFQLNSRQLAFLADAMTPTQWGTMQATLQGMAKDDAEPDDQSTGGGGDPGTYGGENFAGSMYRDATVSSGMAKDNKHDLVVAAIAAARAIKSSSKRH